MNKLAFLAPGVQSAMSDTARKFAPGAMVGDDNIVTQSPFSANPSDTVNLNSTQWKSTFDDDFKRKNPNLAAREAYVSPYQTEHSLGYKMGEGLRGLRDSWGGQAAGILNKGPAIGGLAAAIPGLLAGAAGTGLLNAFTGNEGNVLRNALLGGLLTGGLGAFSGYLRKYKPDMQAPSQQPLLMPEQIRMMRLAEAGKANSFPQTRIGVMGKNAFMRKAAYANTSMSPAESKARIMQLIQSAPGLSFSERSQLTAGVGMLSGPDATQLASSLSGVIGAGAGALIAKFLMNKGLMGTVLGAIFGSTVAKAVFGPPAAPKNWNGTPSMQGMDATGRYIQ